VKPKETDLQQLAKVGCGMVTALPEMVIVQRAIAELTYYRELVKRLPRTNDGVPIVAGDKVWVWWEADRQGSESRWIQIPVVDTYHVNRGWVVSDNGSEWEPSDCYSTRESAIAARAERGTK